MHGAQAEDQLWRPILQKLGYANVAHMDAGLRAWSKGGRPVTTGGS